MRTLVLLALATSSLTGCARGVTIDDAFGRPDATEWTYFAAEPQRVVAAVAQYYSQIGVATESARDQDGGIVLTLASRSGSAETGQILIQATSVEGFATRAQVYPSRRPLPLDVETFVTREP